MNKLETPDDIDDFYDAVDATEEKVFHLLQTFKAAKDPRVACVALLRAASVAHQVHLNYAELSLFLTLAMSVYGEMEETIKAEEDV